MSKPDPLNTIQQLIQERYSNALCIFWSGSVSQDQGTSTSDLDLVIVFDTVPNAYREAFIYNEWPIDAFIHDKDTLGYVFEESRTGNGISGTISMILNGREITTPSPFSKRIKKLAEDFLKAGPAAWDKQQIDKERFLITDALDDIKYPASEDEQRASAAWLFEALGQFYFRSQNKWCASSKSIIRYLKNENPRLADEFSQSFKQLFQTGKADDLELLTKKILSPYGGLLWDGFKSDAPKLSKACTLPKLIQQLELSLLEPSVRNSPKQINQLIADDFLEFGSSGKIYKKSDCLNPNVRPRTFIVNDFKANVLSEDVILTTYKTTEDEKTALRSSLWKQKNGQWQMVFHQGTIVQDTNYD